MDVAQRAWSLLAGATSGQSNSVDQSGPIPFSRDELFSVELVGFPCVEFEALSLRMVCACCSAIAQLVRPSLGHLLGCARVQLAASKFGPVSAFSRSSAVVARIYSACAGRNLLFPANIGTRSVSAWSGQRNSQPWSRPFGYRRSAVVVLASSSPMQLSIEFSVYF